MSQSMGNVDSSALIASAEQYGMSQKSVGILINNLSPITNQGAMGVSVNNLAGDDVTLYCRIIDASGSMGRHAHDLIAAANLQLEALRGSKSADSILMSTWFFNDNTSVLHSYLALPDALTLDLANYQTGGNTAMYDAVLDAITSTVTYAQSLRNAGVTVRVVIVILSDGEDNVSHSSAGALNTVITDLYGQELYTVAMTAFGFRGEDVARKIGIHDTNIRNKDANAHDIRSGFEEVSKSVITTSISKVVSKNGFFN